MKTILLIEDEKPLQENLVEILTLAKYNVICAENGKTGLEIAVAAKPHLIICDISMPELDGYGVLYFLKRRMETKHIPFVYLTANKQFRKGMNLGADDYLTKPFENDELLNSIELRIQKGEHNTDHSSIEMGRTEKLETIESWIAKIFLAKKISFYKKREFIFSEGESLYGIFYLKSGKAKTFKTSCDGKEYITGLYNSGDFMGSLSLIGQIDCKESCAVLTDSEIYFVPNQELKEIFSNNEKIVNQMIQLLSNNLMEREERLLNLAYSSVRKRVAETLLMVSNKFHLESMNSPFVIDILREELASIAGVTKETLIRTISSFNKEGFIATKKGKIIINDDQKLRNVS